MLVACHFQAANVLVGHIVSYRSAQIPKKALRFFNTADYSSRQNRQIFYRIVSKLFPEFNFVTVSPILGAHFITIGNHILKSCLTIFRYPLQKLTNKLFEMKFSQFAVHFINFIALPLWCRRGVLRSCRGHSNAQNSPISLRCVPA